MKEHRRIRVAELHQNHLISKIFIVKEQKLFLLLKIISIKVKNINIVILCTKTSKFKINVILDIIKINLHS